MEDKGAHKNQSYDGKSPVVWVMTEMARLVCARFWGCTLSDALHV